MKKYLFVFLALITCTSLPLVSYDPEEYVVNGSTRDTCSATCTR